MSEPAAANPSAAAAGPDPGSDAFEALWASPTGFPGVLSAVNNQVLGVWFMATAFGFFMIAGVLALVMRVQLAVPDNDVLGPEVYNQYFTMHGSTMMYLFAVPFLEGLAVYLLPPMLGSRDLAFPRLTAFSYWAYLAGGLVFFASFAAGAAPDVGWFAYTPLSGDRYSGIGTDFWVLGLGLVELAGVTAGVEIVVTILKLRAPGMSLNRLPLLGWTLLIAGLMILFAFTTLLTATLLLECDRVAGTHFFDPRLGGDSLLWQHLFWFFGHPEVYIIFLPATGIVSMVVTAAARRIVGYTLITVAIVITGFVSFGLWVHHMYTTGLPELSMMFFAAASLMIAVASGTQVFAWIASLWGRRPPLTVPLLYVLGFLFIFVLGGLTGVMIAVVPFDTQVHDTYFIVAHFHYVLIGGAVFPVLAGLHFWLPKITGRMHDRRLGVLSFWLVFVGFNFTFFPMHLMGLLGLPRRVYTYPAELGLGDVNMVVSVAAFVLAAGFAVFAVNVLGSLRSGPPAEANPWGADSLEWTLSSPPGNSGHRRPPIVAGRHPAWVPAADAPEPAARAAAALDAAPTGWRATLCTSALRAAPQSIQALPGPTYLPLLTALGITVAAVSVLAEWYLVAPAGAVFAAGALLMWLRPDRAALDRLAADDLPDRAGLPVLAGGDCSVAWWGLLGLMAITATVFLTLFYSYFYLWLYSPVWPQGGLEPPDPLLPAAGFLLPPIAAGIQWLSHRAFRSGRRIAALLGHLAAAGAGALFLAFQAYELLTAGFPPQANAYASAFHVTHWALALTVLSGIVTALSAAADLTDGRDGWRTVLALSAEITAHWSYLIAAAAIAVFGVLYLSPYLI